MSFFKRNLFVLTTAGFLFSFIYFCIFMTKSKKIIFFVFLLCILGSFFPSFSITQAQEENTEWSIPLEVTNTLSFPRTREPITNGVPLAADLGVMNLKHLSLLNSQKKNVPAQFKVLARWGGTPEDSTRPIKWVLVTFFADIPAQTKQTYLLTQSQELSTISPALALIKKESMLSVYTGTAEFLLDPSHTFLFKQVSLQGKPILSKPMQLRLTDLSGKTIDVADQTADMKILEQGPLRSVIQINGSLSNPEQTSVLDYRLFITFYAGSSSVNIVSTIGNHQKAAQNGTSYDVFDYGGTNSIDFSDLRITLSLTDPQTKKTYILPKENGLIQGKLTQSLYAYQDSSGTEYWNRYEQEDLPRPNANAHFRGYQIQEGSSVKAQGNHFDGWMYVGDKEKGLTVALVDFWQNFPKAFDIDKSANVGIALFPKQAAKTFNLRVGEEKTTELFLSFSNKQTSVKKISDHANALLNPLWALASNEDLIASGAIPELTSTNTSFEERLGKNNSTDPLLRYEYYNDRTLQEDPLYTGLHYRNFHSLWQSSTQAPSSTDYFNHYGWAAYGNQPLEDESFGDGKSGYFNLKYDFDWGAWMQFLRTRDPNWKDLAQASSRYQEQLMLHEVETETGWDIARWKNAVFGHAQHNESGNTNGARNKLGPVMDTAWGARGAALSYYLTGSQLSRVFVENFTTYAYDFYQDRRESEYLWNASERYTANLLSVLAEGYSLTGEKKFQQLAHEVIDYYTPEKQPYINGPITENSTDYVRPWMLSAYLCALGRYATIMETSNEPQEAKFAKETLVRFTDWMQSFALVQSKNGWLTTNYSYYVNADERNEQEENMLINNWTLATADVFAYAFKFTGQESYLNTATSLFQTGVMNPYYENSPLIYSSSKEAVNHMVFGQVYLSNQKGQIKNDVPEEQDDNTEIQVQPTPQNYPIETEPESPNGKLVQTFLPVKDAYIQAGQNNFGASEKLIAYNSTIPVYRSLLQFDVSAAPKESIIKKATLQLHGKNLYGTSVVHTLSLVKDSWKEGTGTYGNTQDGVSWISQDGFVAWQNPGADTTNLIKKFSLQGTQEQIILIDLTSVVQSWIQGQQENNGLVLGIDPLSFYQGSQFSSKENIDKSKQPVLLIEY